MRHSTRGHSPPLRTRWTRRIKQYQIVPVFLRVPRGGEFNVAGGLTMFGSGIKLDKALLAKVKRYADLAGYSSVEEFITHALEKEIAQLETADSEEDIKKRLKGLGYIS